MIELFANSGDPDQTPHSAASELGLYCLPVTLLGVSSLQWDNEQEILGAEHMDIKTDLPQGYKTFFMLSSAEHEIFSASKYEKMPTTVDIFIIIYSRTSIIQTPIIQNSQ